MKSTIIAQSVNALARCAHRSALPVVALLATALPTASQSGAIIALHGSIVALRASTPAPAHRSTPSANTGLSFYVSPTGNDHNPGTAARPFRTLSRAQTAVRARTQTMTENITVYLKQGTYQLTRPLQFDARDSGANGHTVVWRAASGADVVISGARRISGWTLSNRSKGIWSAAVPSDLRTRQLYVNGMRAVLASGPVPVTLIPTRSGYRASSALMAHWRNPNQIEFVYTGQLGLMAEPMCPVASIIGTRIVMAQPCWDNSTRRQRNLVGFGTLGSPAYAQNAYELLDQPGEFYLDQSRHTLSYIPRQGEDMRTADVEAPVLQTLVEGQGKPDAPVQNITFSSVQFSYATWLRPGTPDGFSEVQANYTVTGARGYSTQGLCHTLTRGEGTCPYGTWTKEPGNVEFSYDRNIAFINDRFVHLGAAGLNLDNGSQHDAVVGSVFTDISGNGLEIGSVNLPEAGGPEQTRSISVTNNHFYGLAVEYHGGVGVLAGYVADSTIAYNQLDHLPYTAISMGWGGWPDKIRQAAVDNNSHDNVVTHNLIYDFMEMLADGGGIYTQGITGPSLAHGQKVIGNVIRDKLAWSYALHSDNGASDVTYAGNALYDNNYDYCCNHDDYTENDGGGDPQLIENNYWQQGDSKSTARHVLETGNIIISGPKQVPASILAHTGIKSRYRSILRWHWPGESVPSAPNQVTVLYAFRGQAYVSWHPSFVEGSEPLTSYTVTACRVIGPDYPARCNRAGMRPVTVSTTAYRRLGYAVMRGLRTGAQYSFTVTAQNRNSSSTPSIPSSVVTVGARVPPLPDKPINVHIRPAPKAVSLIWYAPTSTRCTGRWYAQVCRRPILAFIVTSSAGRRYTITGLSQLIVSNASGRTLRVIGGLHAGQRYRFSIAAVTPAGVGPTATSDPVIPTP